MNNTITLEVYNFDELNDEANAKAIDRAREFERENVSDWLGDDIQWELEGLLKENYIKYDELPKTYYSLNYSQGDGVMFEGRIYWKSYTIDIRQRGNYYHYNSKEFDMKSTKTGKYVNNDVEMKFNNLYVAICQELERYGYDCIETALDDENIIDLIKSNDYEYYEDGSIA